jgi:hypothetical protein
MTTSLTDPFHGAAAQRLAWNVRLSSNNCTTKAIEIGDEFSQVPDFSGIYTPWDFSDCLKNEPYGLCD